MKALPQALVGITLSMVVTSAGADIVLTNTGVGTGNGVNLPNQPPLGTTVLGTLSKPPPGESPDVVFTSSQTLQAFTTGGPNRVESSPRNQLRDFTISIAGFWFAPIGFSVTSPSDGMGTVTAISSTGEQFSSEFPLKASGSNDFSARATGGDLIATISLTSTVDLNYLNNIRFGDTPETSFVPIPAPIVGAGLPALIAACGAMIALARRRRKLA